jgi:hypothetical protein
MMRNPVESILSPRAGLVDRGRMVDITGDYPIFSN